MLLKFYWFYLNKFDQWSINDQWSMINWWSNDQLNQSYGLTDTKFKNCDHYHMTVDWPSGSIIIMRKTQLNKDC